MTKVVAPDRTAHPRPSGTPFVTVVCLAGPSAAGKTTGARLLADRGAVHVPEVTDLFDRPADAPEGWYADRQCDRWTRAVAAERESRLAVLDGDPFQPLWYNWVAAALDCEHHLPRPPSVPCVLGRYEAAARAGSIAFPDAYVLLRVQEEDLRARRRGDTDRRRRNFDYHLRFAEPQRRYFAALADLTPVRVTTVDATTPRRVADAAEGVDGGQVRDPDAVLSVLETVGEWLARTPA